FSIRFIYPTSNVVAERKAGSQTGAVRAADLEAHTRAGASIAIQLFAVEHSGITDDLCFGLAGAQVLLHEPKGETAIAADPLSPRFDFASNGTRNGDRAEWHLSAN